MAKADSNGTTRETASTESPHASFTVSNEPPMLVGGFRAALERSGNGKTDELRLFADCIDAALAKFELGEARVDFDIDEDGTPSFEMHTPFFRLFFTYGPTLREYAWGLATHMDSSKEGILASGRRGSISFEAILGLILEKKQSFRARASEESVSRSGLSIRSA